MSITGYHNEEEEEEEEEMSIPVTRFWRGTNISLYALKRNSVLKFSISFH